MSARVDRWWSSDAGERFWLESTDRSDIGTDLKFPKTDEAGLANWRYTLFLDARPGDVVFHYDKNRGIVGRSIIAGTARSRAIVWGARGTSARDKGTQPYKRPGWVVPLEGHSRIARVIRLDDLRNAKESIRAALHDLRRLYPERPLYFPFETSDKRPLRMLQGYAFKLPRSIVELFPGMRAMVDSAAEKMRTLVQNEPPVRGRGQGFGGSADVNRSIEQRAMDVATAYFKARGYHVKDTSKTMPYDLQVSRSGEVLTVEVKGTTSMGEQVIVTRNEIEHARSAGNCILFIVKNVEVVQVGGAVSSQGGRPDVFWPWNVDSGSLQPISYLYSPRSSAAPAVPDAGKRRRIRR